MPDANTTIDLDPTEVALIIGEEDGSMTIRVVPARELEDGTAEVPEPHEIAIALAMRLLNDPEFHDSVLEWYEGQDDDDLDSGDLDAGGLDEDDDKTQPKG